MRVCSVPLRRDNSASDAADDRVQAYCFWGQSSIFSPFYGAAFVSEFLGTDGVKLAMLDDGTSAIGVYAVFNTGNAPVRLLVVNSNYYDGTGTRSTATVAFSGVAPANGVLEAKRMTAPSATSRVDEGAAVTIGGSTSFSTSCTRTGTQTTEKVNASGGAASVSVRASEALMVFL